MRARALTRRTLRRLQYLKKEPPPDNGRCRGFLTSLPWCLASLGPAAAASVVNRLGIVRGVDAGFDDGRGAGAQSVCQCGFELCRCLYADGGNAEVVRRRRGVIGREKRRAIAFQRSAFLLDLDEAQPLGVEHDEWNGE